ncbi:MAG: hypothetical protein DMG71_02340 [Acidobacteria bacterium]|nr:MAG: hypothetical protein DMG71_02340 [Acidobacteriota bacterium]
MEDGEMVHRVSSPNRKPRSANVEDDLHQTWTIAIKTLHQDRSASQGQRLTKAQFQNAQQNEKEVHRHGARDARQIHFESRGHQCDD